MKRVCWLNSDCGIEQLHLPASAVCSRRFTSLFGWQGEHAATIRKRLAADLTGWKSNPDKFDSQLEQVAKALRTNGGRPPEPEPKLGTWQEREH